jgi:hypothetical protein
METFANQDEPGGIAVDETSVYWGNAGGGEIMAAPVGNLMAAAPLVTGAEFVGAVAFDPTHVYWSTIGAEVARIPKSGGVMKESLATMEVNPSKLAVAGGRVFWTNASLMMPTQGAVRTASVDGGDLQDLASFQNSPSAIAVFDGRVYWTNLQGATAVSSVLISGGNPISLVVDVGTPRGLAVDETGIYVTSHSQNAVLKAPLEGGLAEVVVDGSLAPGAIAVDDANIYWLAGGEALCAGALFAVPK